MSLQNVENILSYVVASLLGIICYVLFDVFWLPAIPFFVFILQLLISSRLGAFHLIPMGLAILQIIVIILIAPTSYLFSFLYLCALFVYGLGKIKYGIFWQCAVYIGWLVVIIFKPGFLLLLSLKYQRILNFLSDMVV